MSKTSKKALYEHSQVQDRRIEVLTKRILGLTTGRSQSNINPTINNTSAYATNLAIMDGIQASHRYITNIPELNMPSNRLEYLWYRYGSLALYKENGRAMISTYSKTGKLNGLGDLTEVQPIDFAGQTHSMKRQVVYDNTLISNPIVIINDYTGAYREEQILPREAINRVSINDEAQIYHRLKSDIKVTAKKAIAILEDENQREAIENSLNDLLDNPSPVIGIVAKGVGELFKVHNLDTKLDIKGYLEAIEAYSRLRANFNGIKTRNSTEKKERLITSEAEYDTLLTDIYLYDGLINRQVGIELAKKHGIISEGSCELNPLFKRDEKEADESKKVDSKEKE